MVSLEIFLIGKIVMLRSIIFLLKRHKITLLIIEPDMQLSRCTKVRYLNNRTTSNLLLIYSVLNDRVDKLFNSLSLYWITLWYSEFTGLLINRTSLQEVYSISRRRHDFSLKNLGKSNILSLLVIAVEVQLCCKVIDTFLNVISNSLLILFSEFISLYSSVSAIRFSPLIVVIYLITILINSIKVKVRRSNHSNLGTMSLRMFLEMLRNFLLQTVVFIRSFMYKGISIIVSINSFTCSISLFLEDLIHHIGIGSFLTTFHISELENIHLTLKT